MTDVIGWDIGGVNTKAALVRNGALRQVLTRPFELQRAPDRLVTVLTEAAAALTPGAAAHAVTMTAELSQMFQTKREGVRFVLDAVDRAFPGEPIHVFTTEGEFVSGAGARACPLNVAAANWVATATLVSRRVSDALLIDVGTTTTDIVPIGDGRVIASGRTDPGRLQSGELVYMGAVRTPVEAIVREVPLDQGVARVSAEGFALVGDALVWLGQLHPDDYDATTPDGRPADRESAGTRLARVVCADREMLDELSITRIAQSIADEEVRQIANAIAQVRTRHSRLDRAVVTGLGAFVAERAARANGLTIIPLSSQLGAAGARHAPAAAVALLLDDRLRPLTVVKIGGSLLSDRAQWKAALDAIASLASSRRLAVVPGGGPFADRVRWMDAEVGLSDEAAHWMAIAGMDQHAELIATVPGFTRVTDPAGVTAAHSRRSVPVIAPLQWMRAADPLPHSWDVTSDSIAAWIAGALAAQRLVLVKSDGATGSDVVDPYFRHALAPTLTHAITTARALEDELTKRAPSGG